MLLTLPLEPFHPRPLNILRIKICQLSYKILDSKRFIYIPKECYGRKYLDHAYNKILICTEKKVIHHYFQVDAREGNDRKYLLVKYWIEFE